MPGRFTKRMWRYQRRATRDIPASTSQLYALASDPDRAPDISPDIDCITDLAPLDGGDRLMACDMRAMGVPYRRAFRYRRRHRKLYAGTQHGRGIVRGYFAFSFLPRPTGTRVVHVEGIRSRIPFLAWAIGRVYYGLLARGKIERELARLETLAESAPPAPSGR